MHHGQEASASHAPCLGNHVLLGDAALEEAIGKALAERDQPAVEYQVGVEHHQTRMTLGLVHERARVRGDEPMHMPRSRHFGARFPLEPELTGGRLAPAAGGRSTSNSSTALAYTSGLGAPLWNRYRPSAGSMAAGSMNDTPLPLTVSAISTLGRSTMARSLWNARSHRAQIVTVRAFHVPSEGPELGGEVTEIADVSDPGVGLDLVVVDDDGDLAEAARGRRWKRLPDLPLLELAVARHDVHVRGHPSRRLARTIPFALEIPMPSEPVLASTKGVATSG